MDISQVSACTIPLIERKLDSALDIIYQAGFRKIDLLGRLPHFSVNPVDCDHDAIEKAVAKRGMQIANLGTCAGRSFASPSEAEWEAGLEDLRNRVNLAARFGSPSVRLTAGRPEDPVFLVELCERVGSRHFGILYEPVNQMLVDVEYRGASAGRLSCWKSAVS